MTQDIDLGTFVVGEIPVAIVVTFRDVNGNPLPLDGFVARFVYRERHSITAIERTAIVLNQTESKGGVSYTWVSSDMATEGSYSGRLWVGNSDRRFASQRFFWRVQRHEGILPNI